MPWFLKRLWFHTDICLIAYIIISTSVIAAPHFCHITDTNDAFIGLCVKALVYISPCSYVGVQEPQNKKHERTGGPVFKTLLNHSSDGCSWTGYLSSHLYFGKLMHNCLEWCFSPQVSLRTVWGLILHHTCVSQHWMALNEDEGEGRLRWGKKNLLHFDSNV